ncbi:Hypothetical protein, putative [Bodo saltans]|uniref:Uncharacterized protein n=1 Tax=Bodo saltans TaxID=75058 RepID=A0A0S4JL65_BODSA|nr:Hypothetical protein, putative [Bodo saltans]|eukprot:CUG92277.1 Hypothetical protein, putative [Bodo saltans]
MQRVPPPTPSRTNIAVAAVAAAAAYVGEAISSILSSTVTAPASHSVAHQRDAARRPSATESATSVATASSLLRRSLPTAASASARGDVRSGAIQVQRRWFQSNGVSHSNHRDQNNSSTYPTSRESSFDYFAKKMKLSQRNSTLTPERQLRCLSLIETFAFRKGTELVRDVKSASPWFRQVCCEEGEEKNDAEVVVDDEIKRQMLCVFIETNAVLVAQLIQLFELRVREWFYAALVRGIWTVLLRPTVSIEISPVKYQLSAAISLMRLVASSIPDSALSLAAKTSSGQDHIGSTAHPPLLSAHVRDLLRQEAVIRITRDAFDLTQKGTLREISRNYFTLANLCKYAQICFPLLNRITKSADLLLPNLKSAPDASNADAEVLPIVAQQHEAESCKMILVTTILSALRDLMAGRLPRVGSVVPSAAIAGAAEEEIEGLPMVNVVRWLAFVTRLRVGEDVPKDNPLVPEIPLLVDWMLVEIVRCYPGADDSLLPQVWQSMAVHRTMGCNKFESNVNFPTNADRLLPLLRKTAYLPKKYYYYLTASSLNTLLGSISSLLRTEALLPGMYHDTPTADLFSQVDHLVFRIFSKAAASRYFNAMDSSFDSGNEQLKTFQLLEREGIVDRLSFASAASTVTCVGSMLIRNAHYQDAKLEWVPRLMSVIERILWRGGDSGAPSPEGETAHRSLSDLWCDVQPFADRLVARVAEACTSQKESPVTVSANYVHWLLSMYAGHQSILAQEQRNHSSTTPHSASSPPPIPEWVGTIKTLIPLLMKSKVMHSSSVPPTLLTAIFSMEFGLTQTFPTEILSEITTVDLWDALRLACTTKQWNAVGCLSEELLRRHDKSNMRPTWSLPSASVFSTVNAVVATAPQEESMKFLVRLVDKIISTLVAGESVDDSSMLLLAPHAATEIVLKGNAVTEAERVERFRKLADNAVGAAKRLSRCSTTFVDCASVLFSLLSVMERCVVVTTHTHHTHHAVETCCGPIVSFLRMGGLEDLVDRETRSHLEDALRFARYVHRYRTESGGVLFPELDPQWWEKLMILPFVVEEKTCAQLPFCREIVHQKRSSGPSSKAAGLHFPPVAPRLLRAVSTVIDSRGPCFIPVKVLAAVLSTMVSTFRKGARSTVDAVDIIASRSSERQREHYRDKHNTKVSDISIDEFIGMYRALFHRIARLQQQLYDLVIRGDHQRSAAEFQAIVTGNNKLPLLTQLTEPSDSDGGSRNEEDAFRRWDPPQSCRGGGLLLRGDPVVVRFVAHLGATVPHKMQDVNDAVALLPTSSWWDTKEQELLHSNATKLELASEDLEM